MSVSLLDWYAAHAPEPPAWWYSARKKTHPKEDGMERDVEWRFHWARYMVAKSEEVRANTKMFEESVALLEEYARD